MSCLAAAAFGMRADIMRQTQAMPEGETGDWVLDQNPVTGEIQRTWSLDSDPSTGGVQLFEIGCDVRPMVANTRTFGGNAEDFTAKYSADVVLKMKFSTDAVITLRDRVTNIRNSSGAVVYQNTDMPKEEDAYTPTIFDVEGIVPAIGPFGEVLYQVALLCRAETQ